MCDVFYCVCNLLSNLYCLSYIQVRYHCNIFRFHLVKHSISDELYFRGLRYSAKSVCRTATHKIHKQSFGIVISVMRRCNFVYIVFFAQFIKEIISHISAGCFFWHICIFAIWGISAFNTKHSIPNFFEKFSAKSSSLFASSPLMPWLIWAYIILCQIHLSATKVRE